MVATLVIAAGCSDVPEGVDVLGAGKFARVAVAPDGLAVVVWQDRDRIVARTFVPATGWSAPELLFEGKRRADSYSWPGVDPMVLAINGSGQAVAVWNDWDVAADVWAARFDPAEGWDEAVLVHRVEDLASPSYIGPHAVIGEDGAATIAHFEDGVWAIRGDPDGSWAAPELVAAELALGQVVGAIAAPDGAIEVAWLSYATRLVAGAVRWTPAEGWAAPVELLDLGQAGGFYAEPASLAVGRDGTGLMLLRGSGGLRAIRHDPALGWGAVEDIASTNERVRAAIDEQGRAIVAWSTGGTVSAIELDPTTGWSAATPIGEGFGPIEVTLGAVAWLDDGTLWSSFQGASSSWSTPELLATAASGRPSLGDGLVVWATTACDDTGRCELRARLLRAE